MKLEFGKVLTELRNKKHLTQQQMADALEIKRERYNAWENNISQPNMGMLQQISAFHKVSLNYLVDFAQNKESVVIEHDQDNESTDTVINAPKSLKAWLRADTELLPDEKEQLSEELEDYFRARKERIIRERNKGE